MFDNQYRNRRVLVTGHTGFKGSWMCHWLQRLGAQITGIALEPPTSPNHFELLDLNIDHHLVDIRDAEKLSSVIKRADPEIVFHMAAQPLVRYSYREPIQTFDTNIMGTVNLYEACRQCESLSSIVTITSDKVYQNMERPEGYDESDRLGGADPYSCSKACTELVTECYRGSFFMTPGNAANRILIATVRAGNVIGGGDWALDRIVADIARAASEGKPTQIRNPLAIRPWQHVLEPLAGYLLVGARLLKGDATAASAWNFGPQPDGMVCVGELVREMGLHWPDIVAHDVAEVNAPKETSILTLQSDKSQRELGWRPVWSFQETIKRVANWYRLYYEQRRVQTESDIDGYIDAATAAGLAWTSEPQSLKS